MMAELPGAGLLPTGVSSLSMTVVFAPRRLRTIYWAGSVGAFLPTSASVLLTCPDSCHGSHSLLGTRALVTTVGSRADRDTLRDLVILYVGRPASLRHHVL